MVVVEQLNGHRLRVSSGGIETFVEGGSDSPDVFRSVDLLLGSLGSCMVGTMLTAAEAARIDVSDVRVELRPVLKMSPERVGRIRIKMSIGGELTAAQLITLRAAAESCKVHNSLHAGIDTELEIQPLTGSEASFSSS